MRSRRGFTLLEIMIALVISGSVISLAYATLGAGLDTERRVTDARDTEISLAISRAVLTDALRHATLVDAHALRVESDVSGRVTRFTFASRGVEAPLGGSALWLVDLALDSSGVVLRAQSVSNDRVALKMTAAKAHIFSVQFVAQAGAAWQAAWPDSTRLPFAVEVRLIDRQGRDVIAPIVARPPKAVPTWRR